MPARRVVDETTTIAGVGGEVPEARADGTPRGVDTRDEKKDDGSTDVLRRQRIVEDRRIQKEAREVVARVRDVILDLLLDVGVEFLECGDAGTGFEVDRLEDVVHETAEQFAVFGRETEHARDHVDGNVLRVLHGRIDHIE
jgi:hypothetical protein